MVFFLFFLPSIFCLKATGRPGYSTCVRRVAAHSTGDIFGCLENGNIHIWETESGELNISKKISESVLTALSWSPHFHRRVMVGGFSRGLRLFDVNSGDVVCYSPSLPPFPYIKEPSFPAEMFSRGLRFYAR